MHRSLVDASAPAPMTLWLACLLEHFPGRFISEIQAEVGRLPVGLLDEVLEAKGYRQAKALSDAADSAEARKRLPKTGLFARVTEIDFALAAEAVERKKTQHG